MDLSLYIGKPQTVEVAITNPDGTPYPIPDGTRAWLTVKFDLEGDDASALFQVTDDAGLTLPDPSTGVYQAHISAEQASLLATSRVYWWDFQILAPGADPEIPLSGRVIAFWPATKTNS